MKNLKKLLLILPIALVAVIVYGFTVEEEAPPLPLSTITYEQAHKDRALFLKNNPEMSSDFTFDYEEVKKYMDYLEYQRSKGADIEFIRVYLSTYENGTNSAFIAPVKNDSVPDFDIRALNKGNNGVPPGFY